MFAWEPVELPRLHWTAPAPTVYDTQSRGLVQISPSGPTRMYVCGITPYDSTHLGHAATYVGFDLFHRACRNAGHEVTYVQNVTDVDDPLLVRARHLGVSWDVLAEGETQQFREDMAALTVLPPTHFVGVAESVRSVVSQIERLQSAGFTYQVDKDLYFRVSADPSFGLVSQLDPIAMMAGFAERGGDPDRAGKEDPLDCLIWRGERDGDPSWPSPWGRGRPGWHIGCASIASRYLGPDLDLQGGGSDLVFPHHEMTASIGHALHPGQPFAGAFAHAGMVAYNGEKMSKSRGNLVFVSALLTQGNEGAAIRLALLRHHYRSSWEWSEDDLLAAADTLQQWRHACSLPGGAHAAPVERAVLAALANDLDAPAALAIVQRWVDATIGVGAPANRSDPSAGQTVQNVLDAALGLRL